MRSWQEIVNGPGRDRTCDLGIKSPANVSNVSTAGEVGWDVEPAGAEERYPVPEVSCSAELEPATGDVVRCRVRLRRSPEGVSRAMSRRERRM